MNNLLPIAEQFLITGKIMDIIPLGSGHIHETFLIRTGHDHKDDYVLQHFNTNVFHDPDAVMQNIALVTAHIQKKLISSGYQDTGRYVLTPVRMKNGGWMFNDPGKGIWRCFVYITDHKTYDRAVSEEQVYEGGKAYGKFLEYLSDLSADKIKETIPGFHDLDLRLTQFETACRDGLLQRISGTQHEIEMLKVRKVEMRTILELGKAGKIPLRIVHHDTKINNVLFDESDKGLCVIDLDTVMPGYVHDDFGDSIRTFTNTGEEDDADLDRISMNIVYFKAFARGFLGVTNSMLSPLEKEHLALSARVMTYMQALRFLTDYLNGDLYYRIHHPLHNLQRARAQIKLLLSMEEQYGKMKEIIEAI